MNFLDKIKNDMYQAMKENDKNKVRVLRTLFSKLKNKKIDNGGTPLNKKEAISIVKTSIKQLEESIVIYENAKRFELVDKDKNELLILKSYLPKMMSDQEIRTLVIEVIKESAVDNISQIGKVMPIIMKSGGATIDGKKANMILKELLS